MDWDRAAIIMSGISTLAIYSYLWKENRIFRSFEHLFIGIAAGYLPIVTVKTFLWPQIIEPMLGLNLQRLPDGTTLDIYNPLYLLYLLPFCFGALYYFIFSARYHWIAKVVISFSLGASAGLGVQGFYAEVIPQIIGSFKPFVVLTKEGAFSLLESINNLIFVAILLSVMFYFFFSARYKSRSAENVRLFGRYSMMVCFGAFFGSTVMARLALLVERLQFLVDLWIPSLFGIHR